MHGFLGECDRSFGMYVMKGTYILRDLVFTKDLDVCLVFRVPNGPSLIQHRVSGTPSQEKCSQKIDGSYRTTARKQEEISRIWNFKESGE